MNKSKKENNAKTVKWIFIHSKKYLPVVFLICVFSAIIALSSVSLAMLSRNVLEIATGDRTGSFWIYGIAIIGVVFLQIILAGTDTVLKAYANGKLTIYMRKYLFSVLSRKKYPKIAGYHSGDILNRFTSDTDVIIGCIVNVIPHISTMLAQIIGGVAALLILDKRIALIIFLGGILVPSFGRIISRKYKTMHKDCQQSEGKIRSFMQECFENVVVMKTFGSIVPFTNKLNEHMQKNFRFKMKRSWISAVMHLSLYSFFTIGYYGVLLWGAGKISNDLITYGTLMAFLQLFQQLRAPLQNISGIVPQYYSAIASAERLMEIEQGEEDKPSLNDSDLQKIKNNFSGFEFKNVYFSYGNENILKNCSFNVPKGKITALTGESGSGKSTVFKIILGLYEVGEGELTINGNIPLDPSVRGLFAYVPQGNLLLSGTIKENLTLYNDDIDEQALVKAVKAAEIYDLIESMPNGFDTELSERGAGLSEGQIQRISLARALLTDAPVLLLDEATSALDEETETRVLNNIKAMTDKTVLFVTHRNTSLKVCDRIIHVENKVFSVIKE